MPLEKSKQIARNTLMLYLRMLITILVGLYTSRIVLDVLGVQDYGIYNIVGGVVVLFSFINQAMTGATQRFLSFELGRNDNEQLKKVFSVSVIVHLSIAGVIFVLSETIGLWFLNYQLNIPAERMNAANWVYQFSILAFILGILRVPYNASIIAHERMSFYAYISIVEVLLKLAIVFILQYFHFDKLKLYSILTFSVGLIVLLVYAFYTIGNFPTCRFNFVRDKILYKKLLSFSGWNLFGSIANIGKTQGINVLLNILGGVLINAAMGIANQVGNVLNGFVSNFQIAFRPQIIKSYASNDKEYLMKLIFQTSKFSFFLLFLMSFPILIKMDFILHLWLKKVPEYSAIFCQLTLIYLLIETLSGPLWVAVQATGKIKKYQIAISSILLMDLPISFLALKLGAPYYSVLCVNLGVNACAFIVRLLFLKKLIGFPVKIFFQQVILNILYVILISVPIPLLTSLYFSGFEGLLVTVFISVICLGITVFFVGLKKNEQLFIKNKIFEILKINKFKQQIYLLKKIYK